MYVKDKTNQNCFEISQNFNIFKDFIHLWNICGEGNVGIEYDNFVKSLRKNFWKSQFEKSVNAGIVFVRNPRHVVGHWFGRVKTHFDWKQKKLN